MRVRSTVLLLVTTLVLTACTHTGAGSHQAPAGKSAAPPAVVPVGPGPAVVETPVVTVQVDGVALAPGETARLEQRKPVTVDLAFSLPMDRAAVAAALRANPLPPGHTLTWLDDTHLRVVAPQGPDFSMSLTGASAQNGAALKEGLFFVVRPPTFELNFVSLTDIRAGKTKPARTARVTAYIAGLQAGPDGQTALLYPTAQERGSGPLLVDLTTGKQTDLGLPEGKTDWYSAGGWLPDGRIYLVGAGKVWVGTAAAGLKPVGDAQAEWTVALSGSGRYLAMWGPSETGDITVADLKAGTVRQVAGPFRRGAQDGAISLGWSADETLLAGTDFDRETDGAGMKIRIINPQTGKQVRTIADVGFSAWLPDGGLVGYRRQQASDAPARSVILDAAGKEVRALNAGAGTPSPDGRYLLVNAYKLNYNIVDLKTGELFGFVSPGVPQWAGAAELVAMRPLP